MIDVAILAGMGIFALMVIQSRVLRVAVIYLAVFSLLSALLYLRYAAPELAIAEAAIGSGLVSLLYLAALKRNRLYTVGVIGRQHQDAIHDAEIVNVERSRALREIRAFFVRREFEVQTVFLTESLEEALRNPAYDLVLKADSEGIAAFTDDESYVMLELELMVQMHGTDSALRFVRYAPPET